MTSPEMTPCHLSLKKPRASDVRDVEKVYEAARKGSVVLKLFSGLQFVFSSSTLVVPLLPPSGPLWDGGTWPKKGREKNQHTVSSFLTCMEFTVFFSMIGVFSSGICTGLLNSIK